MHRSARILPRSGSILAGRGVRADADRAGHLAADVVGLAGVVDGLAGGGERALEGVAVLLEDGAAVAGAVVRGYRMGRGTAHPDPAHGVAGIDDDIIARELVGLDLDDDELRAGRRR